MLSMTGFGVAEAQLGDGRLMVEIRSLNHRFLEVRVRMPQELQDQAIFVEQLARERLHRGRYDVGVRLDGIASSLTRASLDLDRARALYRTLAALRDELAPGTSLPVSAVLGMPEVMAPSSSSDQAQVRAALTAAVRDALNRLEAMREAEGLVLRAELRRHLDAARKCRENISARADDMLQHYRCRLEERLQRLLRDFGGSLDPCRLEAELAIMADRSDITEEIARIACHLDQFDRLLDAEEPVGRRLDFLLQEIAREANTVGAKSQHADLAHLVVELKAATERMREQVQNVQ